ncbi:HalOD1 output domain-containing protein [Haloferax sp. YSSS75]|uniref:HalOD1 output domain-containing protein n=1 Tax=Haloferax sp. YSSS75 TaxID=3388564 RepID=UPI00398D3379
MNPYALKSCTSVNPALALLGALVARKFGIPAVVSAPERDGGGELQPPLFEVVDPDALNTLLTNGPNTEEAVSISFDYAGYRITVDSNQTVTVK